MDELIRNLRTGRTEDEYWHAVLEQGCSLLQAEAGTYFALNEDGNALTVMQSVGVLPWRLSKVPFPLTKGICGWVATHRETICVNDVRNDERFYSDVDLVTQFETRSVLCAPVMTEDRFCGVLEIINRKDRPFTESDILALRNFGRIAAGTV